jgi:endonuclease YncB( thermonuclease family)
MILKHIKKRLITKTSKLISLLITSIIIACLSHGIKDLTNDYIEKVIDGDTIKLKGQKIRLYGIDAPEKKQICAKNKLKWPCGHVATEYLIKLTENKKVSCRLKNKDRYNRIVAICSAGTMDLSKEMVKNGMAVAYREYSKDYIPDEKYAKDHKLGIWQGSFQKPSDYRKKK